MKIAVCIKQVPATDDLRIDPETNTLIREGVHAVLNPLDEFPLEAALQLKDQGGATVTVFTMGPPQARQVLQQCVARGADSAVLVSDRRFAGADTWATSLTLARALAKNGPFDLILCGKQATDGDTAQVGPGIAAHLRIPQITYATRLAVEPDRKAMRVWRLLENGTAVLKTPLPVLITVLKEANEPRLPAFQHLLRSLSQEPLLLTADDLELAENDIGLAGSPTRVVTIMAPKAQRQQRRFEGEPAAAVAELLKVLKT